MPVAAATWAKRLEGRKMQPVVDEDPSSDGDALGVHSVVEAAAEVCYRIWRRKAQRRPSELGISTILPNMVS